MLNNEGVAFGNGTFLSFGTNIQNKSNLVLQSTNGINWTAIYTSSNPFVGAAYGNGKWVFIATNELAVASTNWSEFELGFSPACISYINGTFLLGANFDEEYAILSSTDGLSWQYLSNLFRPPGLTSGMTPSALTGIVYNNGVYAATVGYSGGGYYYSYLCVSSNLMQWFPVVTNSATLLAYPIASGGNYFAASLGWGLYASSNGYAWKGYSPPYFVEALTFGQGAFVAVDIYGNIYQSGFVAAQSNSTPTMLSIASYPGVTINGTPGVVYQIQRSTNLTSDWTTITNFVLPISPFIWVDTSPMAGKRFYRSVQVQ
jgi:hypothetical protein